MASKLTQEEMDSAIKIKKVRSFDDLEINTLYSAEHEPSLSKEEALDFIKTMNNRWAGERGGNIKLTEKDLEELSPIVKKNKDGTKFTTKLKKHIYEKYGKNPPASYLEEFGDKISENCVSDELVYFKFVDSFDWKSGDFGDGFSCFWGGKNYSKQAILDNGGRAILFFNAGGKGFARAWVGKTEEGLPFFFNAYGTGIKAVANFFGFLTGTVENEVSFTNDSDVTVNGDRIIALSKKYKPMQMVFGWNVFGECPTCGKITNRGLGRLSKLPSASNLTQSTRIDMRCVGCKRTNFRCPFCEKIHKEDELLKFNPKGNLFDTVYWVCPNCYEIIFVTCCICGEKADREEFVAEGRIMRHKECRKN